MRCSSLYRSKPVGPENQPDYINAVVMLDTALSALTLLNHMRAIEDQQGRIRDSERWGPRTLDLDLLLYGNEKIHDKHLIVPHQEMHKRNFILYPLHELSPEIDIPGHGPLAILIQNTGQEDLEKIEPA
ncbi:MAG: 2-amino-4-hydroxy-6-hydroxymethyldihydropteridine pyrophosphokinase [Gammaproteobacteria bacterium]|nr:2-amino-4-hydroxy-6-hydroxymethyldihydropteridine pyrophosphokinase [Gammaproteobacteria bacterium]